MDPKHIPQLSRRQWLLATAGATAGMTLPVRAGAQEVHAHPARPVAHPSRWPESSSGGPLHKGLEPGLPGRDYTPVITPNGTSLPWKIVDGVKVYHLIAEEVEHEFAPGLSARCWGYNGRVHGPTLEAVEGDRVRVYVTNRLPAPTTVHWHGVFLENGMDGVGGLNQPVIRPGETFIYEWTFRQHGTLMYHPHHDEMTQMAMGMMGLIVVHPRGVPREERPDKDFALLLSEWKIEPGARRPDPAAMNDFNLLTLNARCYPGTAPLVCGLGDKVRLRLGNLSAMDHHPIHLHGYAFRVVATDGGDIPPAGQWPETTVLVPTGSTRDLEFVTDAPGDWAMHCHMTHHLMNQMGHGLPNLMGARFNDLEERLGRVLPGYMTMGTTGMGDMAEMAMPAPANSLSTTFAHGPHGVITMGGMFTLLKVRERGTDQSDPGWYRAPPETQARVARGGELARDGIAVPAAEAPQAATTEMPADPDSSAVPEPGAAGHGHHHHHGH